MNTNRKSLAKAMIVLCVGIAALVAATALAAQLTANSATPVVAKVKAKHKSRISGTATLTAVPSGVRVVLRLNGPVRGNSPAHIHTGPCRREPTFANPRISSSLKNVTKRRSVTVVTYTTLERLRSRRHSINVHDPNTLGVVACADIPRAS